MSGLVKAKEYDLKDSNVQNIGSDADRNVKKAAAETEKAWKGAGDKPGIQIWRIEKFEVVPLKGKPGEFYRGDSYIILNTFKEPDSEELNYDLHFWLGKESTQDEMGTAAYKTVELDTLLDDKPKQYREIEGFESTLFQTYFKRIIILEGGVDSGFNHVETNSAGIPPSCIFELCGETDKDIEYSQVPKPSWNSLHSHSTFAIIIGRNIIKFHGTKSNKNEKYGLAVFLNDFKSAHPRLSVLGCIDGDAELECRVKMYQKRKENSKKEKDDDDDDTTDDEENQPQEDDELMEILVSFLGEPPENFDVKCNKNPQDVNKRKVVPCEDGFVPKLVTVDHDKRTGNISMEVCASGQGLSSYACDEKHCYIMDKGTEVFAYAGKNVDKKDKKNLMADCNLYLADKVNKHARLSMEKNLRKFEEKVKK